MWITARNAVSRYLKEVMGVRIVHNYPRIRDDKHMADYLDLMISPEESRINAWSISRLSLTSSFVSNKHILVVHEGRLTGVLEHNDEKNSQDEFDGIIDRILLRFFSTFNLGGAVEIQGPAALLEEGFDTVAATFVHRAEIQIALQQRIHVENNQWQLLMGSSQS